MINRTSNQFAILGSQLTVSDFETWCCQTQSTVGGRGRGRGRGRGHGRGR